MTRNPIFTAIHAALAEWLLEQRRTTLAAGEDVKAYEAHRLIFEAVAARDPDRAERAMREHLEYVARRYTEVVGAAAMSGFVIIVDFRLKPGARGRVPPHDRRQCARLGAATSPAAAASTWSSRRASRTASCSTRSTTTKRRSMRIAATAHFARLRRRERAAGGRQACHVAATWSAKDRRQEA